jgi:hypothetical protein
MELLQLAHVALLALPSTGAPRLALPTLADIQRRRAQLLGGQPYKASGEDRPAPPNPAPPPGSGWPLRHWYCGSVGLAFSTMRSLCQSRNHRALKQVELLPEGTSLKAWHT